MLFHSHVPLHLWVEALFAACFITNLLPSSVLKNQSPFEVLFNQKPNYSMLRVFGSACYMCLRPITSHKFEPMSLQCVFLGYHTQYKGYRCLYPPTGQVYISRHVLFDETCFPFTQQYKSFIPKYQTPILKAWQLAIAPMEPDESSTSQIPPPHIRKPPTAPLHETTLPETNIQVQQEDLVVEQEIQDETETSTSETEESTIEETQNIHPMVTRAKADIHKPNTRYVLLASKFTVEEPKNIDLALKHPGWNQAVNDEMGTIHMLHTWSLVPRTKEMNVLGSNGFLKPNSSRMDLLINSKLVLLLRALTKKKG